jgi:hypothetical protein
LILPAVFFLKGKEKLNGEGGTGETISITIIPLVTKVSQCYHGIVRALTCLYDFSY